jgi:hypothetical protein
MIKNFTGFHKLRTRTMLDITTEDVLLEKIQKNGRKVQETILKTIKVENLEKGSVNTIKRCNVQEL